MSWSVGDWMCGSCQHHNFRNRDTCQRCDYPKFGGPDVSSNPCPSSEGLAGDWYCTAMNCGAHNYAKRSTCYRCGAVKNNYGGIPPGYKPGDWFCTRYGCEEHNYARREECYKCKTPRGYGGAA